MRRQLAVSLVLSAVGVVAGCSKGKSLDPVVAPRVEGSAQLAPSAPPAPAAPAGSGSTPPAPRAAPVEDAATPATAEGSTTPPSLRAAPALGVPFWPTLVCTSGPGALVVANDCGCGEPLVCAVRIRGHVLDLRISGGQRTCKDCGKISARCALPAAARPGGAEPTTFAVTINGTPVIDRLEIRSGGDLSIPGCTK